MQEPLVSLFLLSSVVSAGTALLAWRHRRSSPAATALAVAMLGLAWWSGSQAVLHSALPYAVLRTALALVFVGVGGAVAGFYCLGRVVAAPDWRPTRRLAALLCLEPACTVALGFLNPGSLFYRSVAAVGDPPVIEREIGPLYLAHAAFCYALLVWPVVALVRHRRQLPAAYRPQVTSLLLASTIPMAVELPAVLLGFPDDYTPVVFVLSGLAASWAVFRQGLLRLVPVARDLVVDTVTDAILVIDPLGRVLDINASGLALLRRLRPSTPDRLIGLPAVELIGPTVVGELDRGQLRDVVEAAPGCYLDFRISLLHDARGRQLGRVVVARDVSEQHAQQLALEAANASLEAQLAEIDRLRARLAEEATRDSLTGLHNRRYLVRALDRALSAGRAAGRPVAVVLIDVDHFKRVNDTYGHGAGDRALKAVARILQSSLRRGETLARYGGEEFVLVIPGATLDTAVARAEALRGACAAQPLRTRGDGAVRVTLSAGVAVTDGSDGRTASTLLDSADTALYAAKAEGRDRVIAERLTAPR
ncbi:GGDEF domain-containing protein [Motilibacter deserti]|uniref:DUF2339 domain-containing protein n=1 Tax=Motilibacter deserti TaxID=2714956 RepID=A0ABX0GNN3_9ACTN|nr:diguanylate cyclase [Motilibacter deserti]NHC12446.1 DUF2339 domain-containing protein [Motilibacter deserti]